jgi:hypothetical protein
MGQRRTSKSFRVPFATSDEEVNERLKKLVKLGESYMNQEVRHQMSGVSGRVIGWEIGKKLNGVWLITTTGKEVYRPLRG